MDKETRYKKALAKMLFWQAQDMTKSELQDVLFFEEETTEKWTLDKCRIQYVLDQLQFIEGGNWDEEIEETWQLITSKERN